MPKVTKIRSLHVFAISPKNMGDKVGFFKQNINTKVFYKVVVSFWMCETTLAQSTQNNKFAISLKMGRVKLIFCLQKSIKNPFKLILSSYVCVARHAQITQNNKFYISLQYLKKKVSDEVDFLHAEKDESYLQIDIMIFDGDGQAFPKFPK